MSTVVFRSDSPYVPRATEMPRRAPALSMVPDTERALRILVTSYCIDPTIATQDGYVSELARALIDLGHHVDVATGPPYCELDARVGHIKLGWRFDDAPFIPARLKLEATKLLFGHRLWHALRGRGAVYDLAITNGSLGPGIRKLKRMGLPVVCLVHDSAALARRSHKKTLALIDGLVVASPGAAETIANELKFEAGKIAVVPRGNAPRGERVAKLIVKLCVDLTRS